MASVSSRATGSFQYVLPILLLLALVLRLGWAVSRPVNAASIDALPDQREYLSIAQNLLKGNGFEFIDPRFNQTVRAFRTPGYPLFLAICGANIRAARAVQAVIDTSTVLAVFLLARAIGLWNCASAPSPGTPGEGWGEGSRGQASNWTHTPALQNPHPNPLPEYRERGRAAALIAAGLIALNPYLIYFTGLLLSETLFTAMLLWAMVLLVQPSMLRRFGGLLILALSVPVRPSAILLPVFLGILSAFVNRLNPPAYQGAPSAPVVRPYRCGSPLWVGLCAAGMILLTLLPWAVRNHDVLNRWIWLDTNSGFTLYDAYNPGATGASSQSFMLGEAELQKLNEVDRSQYLARKAMDYVRKHPGRAIQLMGAKLLRTWSPIPLSSEYGKPALRLIALAYSVPFYILVLAGLFRAKLPRSAKVFLLAPAIYLSVVHALTIGSLRYRVPAEPPLAVIAGGMVVACCGADKFSCWLVRKPE